MTSGKMKADKFDEIVKRFWKWEKNDTRYYLGFCSEVAVAMDKFLNKKGKIGKHGWFHTIYIWDGYYWDIRGKMTKRELDFKMPIGATDEPRPAKPEEIKHIYDLLNVKKVNYILKGFKDAQRGWKM